MILAAAAPPLPPPAAEGEYKHKIVQRGAVPPLIDMLANDDNQLREMAAFALGRLAQNADNQVGAGWHGMGSLGMA